MKKTRLSHRILAMVLVILMTVQLLPLSAFAKFGDLQSWNPGVDLSTLKQEDAINWPIKIYDYLSDGMLFEWMDTNAGSTSDGHHTVTNKDSSVIPRSMNILLFRMPVVRRLPLRRWATTLPMIPG